MCIKSYFISNATISIDLDKFESGKSNKLFIIGVCGSGKTSTGILFSRKYNVKYCSFDECWDNFLINGHPQPKCGMSTSEMNNIVRHCIEDIFLSSKCKIIEGVNILDICRNNNNVKKIIMNSPCIIMGRSAILGAIEGALRNKKQGLPFWSELLTLILHNLNYFQSEVNQFRKDRTSQPNSTIKQFIEQ